MMKYSTLGRKLYRPPSGTYCFRRVRPSQKLSMQLLHFEREFFKPLHSCLLLYGELHIVTAFLKELFPFLTLNISTKGVEGVREKYDFR